MKCYICQRSNEDVEAVALQSEVVSVPQPCTIEGGVYIPVCEEHKSDSTENGMVVPLLNGTEQRYQKELSGAIRGMDIMQAGLNNSKTEIERLEKRLSRTGKALELTEAIRNELEIETAQRQSVIRKLKQDLQNAVTDYRSEQSALEESQCANAERDNNSNAIMAFMREYFATRIVPGLEAGYDIEQISGERFIELIKIAHSIEVARNNISDFIDSNELIRR